MFSYLEYCFLVTNGEMSEMKSVPYFYIAVGFADIYVTRENLTGEVGHFSRPGA
jgi:hypothetical protein